MTDLKEKIEYFKTKQAEIEPVIEAFKKEEAEIVAEYNHKISELRAAGEMKIAEAKKKVDRLFEPLKLEQKAYFGTCIGETADLITTIELMHKIASAPKA